MYKKKRVITRKICKTLWFSLYFRHLFVTLQPLRNHSTIYMKKYLITNLLVLMALSQAHAENKTIDISGDNTDKTAKTYATALTIQQGDTVNVLMAR